MAEHKLSRNDACPCGSGKKFKKCCLRRGSLDAVRPNSSWGSAVPTLPAFVYDGPQPSSVPPSASDDDLESVVEDLAGTADIPDLPDPGDVRPLPVEIGLDYTYEEPFGTAEVSYILPAGRPYILANGEEILNDDLQPGMRILLKDGAVATVTGVRHFYEPPDPPVRALDGRMLSRVVGSIQHKGFSTVDVAWPGYTATSSPDHPYYSVSRGGYVPAQDLKVGEFLRTDDDLLTPVQSVSKSKFGMVDLYNVEVEDFHNYYVGRPGGGAVLVHNSATPGNYINTPAIGKGGDPEGFPVPAQGMSIEQLQAALPAINAKRAKLGMRPQTINQKYLQNPKEWYYDPKAGTYARRPAPAVDLSGAGLTREIPCFPEGVPVVTPLGPVSIECIEIGSEILSYDVDRQTVVVQRVTEVLRNRSVHVVEVVVAGETIQTTLNHPFWVSHPKQWLPAQELKTGMQVKLSDLSIATIESITVRRTAEQRTFNLTVEGCHTYFVGYAGVLVHNANNPNDPVWVVYFGYSPTDTEFKSPIYIGKTNDLMATQARHRADALENPSMAYKKDIFVRPIAGMDQLVEMQAFYHEAAIYHKMKDAGHQWGGQQQPMTKKKLNALAAAYC